MEERVVAAFRDASYSAQVMITSLMSSPWHFFVATMFTLICLALVIEQLCYLKKKRFAPGPSFVVPFLGSTAPMVCNPTKYWNDLAATARSSGHGFSANYLLGHFIVFIQDTELSQKVFTNVKPDAFMCIGHPFGKKLFGEHNLIYLFGEEHKDLRRRIAPNFSLRALSTYLSFQQRIVAQHISKWISMSSNGKNAIPLRLLCRQMNLETSQTVFVGPYLSEEGMEAFNKDYNIFNVGLLALPIDLPGFAFRKAQTAVHSLVNSLTSCVTESKTCMASNLVEPTCLIDFWMQDIIRETEESSSNDAATKVSDSDIGGHLFDFLFAAQDASTSSLLWAMTLLESHPDVLARVRSEVSSIWSPEDSGKPLSFDDIVSMKYTKNVAREIVRFRPPATLVPHLTIKEFPLTEYYTIPKGTIVFPSVFESSFQGFTEPDRFDPDRFSEERQEDRIYKRNFLSFGAGPHQCVGQRYAIHHLVVFIAMFVSLVDFKRHRSSTTTTTTTTTTAGHDDIVYQPTICPRDDCTLYLSQRCVNFPNFY